MDTIKGILPGLIVVLIITVTSVLLSSLHPSFETLALSIIFGMLIANLIRNKEIFNKGIAFALKVCLPSGIALYGTQLSFVGAEPELVFSVIAISAALFALTYLISKKSGLTNTTGLLLSTGLSICGASAIAIVSPIIDAREKETSISLIVILVLGLAGMIFYPLLADTLSISKSAFAFLTGTTLPMLGQVKATASTAGQEILASALRLKLLRISLLLFLPFIAVILSGRKGRFYVPWFIIVFIILAIAANTVSNASHIIDFANSLSRFFLTAALAAIGFSVDFDSIAEEGAKPLIVVFAAWGIIVALLVLIFKIFHV